MPQGLESEPPERRAQAARLVALPKRVQPAMSFEHEDRAHDRQFVRLEVERPAQPSVEPRTLTGPEQRQALVSERLLLSDERTVCAFLREPAASAEGDEDEDDEA